MGVPQTQPISGAHDTLVRPDILPAGANPAPPTRTGLAAGVSGQVPGHFNRNAPMPMARGAPGVPQRGVNPMMRRATGGRSENAHGGLNALKIPHMHSKKIRPPHSMHSVHQHTGAIHSSVAGRTDHLPIHVPSGSYVIPADIISGMGEGNTIAGFKHMRRIFGDMPRGAGPEAYGHTGGPYGKAGQPYDHSGGPYGMASGGSIKHHAAGILFVSPDDKILLLKRAGKDHAGEWALPGGGIEEGESSEQAARRELQEETGHHFKGHLTPATRRKADGVDFTTFLAHAEPFQPKLNDEHDDHQWVSRKEALKENLHPGVKETLEVLDAPAGYKKGGAVKGKTRLLIKGDGPGGVQGIVVPRHMIEGNKTTGTPGLRDINKARAKVYGAENRDPLNIGQIGQIHRETLAQHFQKPIPQQLGDERLALARLRAAKHLGKDSNTLDESEKADTVKFEKDPYVPWTSKGVAGHAVYTSGHGPNEKTHILNTCPGQTEGCSGGVKDGIVDTSRGTCFAPNAESQYVNAAVRRAAHAQAKHDPAMTRDWILAHTGSLREAAAKADKKGLKTLFRPNVVDESDVSSRHVVKYLNKQRGESGLPPIIGNSYGKTDELHDPENGWFVTHSNIGPKTKLGASIAENIGRDRQRIDRTIHATTRAGRDYVNDEGHQTPPKNSYMVTDVHRYSDLDKRMQKAITHAKYWSAGREPGRLSEQEKAEGPEGHFGSDGRPTTPDQAHFGHTTVNGRRYDYQKQHILHPRMITVGKNEDGTPKRIPTDSRFRDNAYLPKSRYMTKNGKMAGAILMTTPTESTSNLGHQSSFTHHVDDSHIAHAQTHNGEYEIDPPMHQEASMGKEYQAPQPISFLPRKQRAAGGEVDGEDDFSMGLPEQNFLAQYHNAHTHHHEEREGYADGGQADGDSPGVPIVAAGGEWVLHPDQVRDAGGGDLDRGHKVLDKWVLRMRKELIHTLKNLAPPKKD